MPPRRSSRSTRASIEPAAAEEPQTTSKRKRSQAPEDEPASKPPSRARSSSARPPSKRTPTRSRGSLPEVEEDEAEEGSDSAPPVKKARPSTEPDEESEAEGEKPKGRRAASVSRRKPSSTASKTGAGPSRSGRATRKPAAEPVAEEDQDEEEEEDVKPARRGTRANGAAKPSSSKRSVVEDEDEEMAGSEDEEEEVVPKAKKGRTGSAKPKATKKAPASRKVPVVTIEDSDEEVEDEDEEDRMPPSAQPRQAASTAPPPTQPPKDEDEEDQDEPASLFDDPPQIPLTHPSQIPKPPPPEEPKGPVARLVIHKLVLINFKSYAGRQEIGPFHKSFSSIVGPNGSGKSNTIDALLFVFGYRASKMRQGKLSELIHNSAKFPDLDECSVEVHFREIIDLPGPDAYEVVPGSSLAVTRLALKNNSSRYTINGKSSTFKEVQTLLKDKGIDLDHNRFLILQGEVESIAQMKPKAATEHDEGLLEYLEDIIGTSQYKEPIDQALVEMEKLQEDRSIKLNRLRIVEKEKAALNEQKKEAEDYLRMKNDLTRAQSRYYQWLLYRLLASESKIEDEKAEIQKTLEEETARYKDDITHLEALKEHYKGREEAYEEIKKAADAAKKDLAAQEREEVSLTERKKHETKKIKKLEKSLADDEKSRAQALRDIDDNDEKMDAKKTEADDLEAKLVVEEKTLEAIRDSLKDKTQKFHDQIEAKQRELQPWMAKINTKQSAVNVATSERDALKKKAADAEARRNEAENNLQELRGDHEVKATELKKIADSKRNLQRELGEAQRNYDQSQRTVDDCRTKANQTRARVDEARASQAENKSQNRVLDSLKRLQDTGRLTGFHGRLGALGTIDDKYDVAISTAAGALHNMVVDRVEQGQECIQYLRSQNVGRATFMVLEKLGKMPGMAKPYETPEKAPRLFDLIKPKDPKFAPAFYKAVGDTLVAKDMDQANRIAYGAKRWRVVTLTGQLIDTSGTMSGGGSQPAKGAMSSKLAADAVRPEVLRNYEQESQTAARRLEAAVQACRAAEDELDKLRNSGPQLDMAYQKLELDIENSKRRIQDAEKRLQEVKSQSKPNASDASRIAALEREIATNEDELEGLREQSGAIEAAIKDLEKKILDIGGARLLTQKSRVEGIKLHISLANEEITKAEVAKAKAEKDAARYETTITNNTTSLEGAQAELAAIQEKLEDVEAYVEKVRVTVKTAQDAEESSRDDLEQLKEELEAKDQEIEEFRQKEVKLRQQLSDKEKEAAECSTAIGQYQSQHDALQLEEIDEDDDDEEEANEAGGAPETAEPNPDAMETDVKAEPDGEAQPKSKKKAEKEPTELHIYGEHELARFKQRELQAEIALLDEKVQNAKPDLSVLKEYKRREEEFLRRASDLENVTNQRDAQKATYDGLRKQRLDEFMAGFNLISLKLKEMYQMITLGGNAELELVDSMDPFSEGIIFSVMPPKKSWKNISNLSGGEKTLSSLALVFALHVFKPTPLYFMDEIDAALDFRNVSIVANYIKDRTKNAQFIIISLRNDMFELSHRLIGIYKTANVTKSVSIDNHALIAPPVAAGAASAAPPASSIAPSAMVSAA